MKQITCLLAFLTIAVMGTLVRADDTTPSQPQSGTYKITPMEQTTETTASSSQPSGTYKATISPPINATLAKGIEQQLNQIEEIKSVDVSAKDSAVRYTVKPNAEVNVSRLKAAVKVAAPNYTMSDPVPLSGGM